MSNGETPVVWDGKPFWEALKWEQTHVSSRVILCYTSTTEGHDDTHHLEAQETVMTQLEAKHHFTRRKEDQV